jgi:flagellar operon protein
MTAADGLVAALGTEGIRVSGHALRRLSQTSAPLPCFTARRLRDGIEQAEQKGSKDALIMLDDFAFIVSIEHKMVVTAVEDRRSMEGVFTQIDTVVFR